MTRQALGKGLSTLLRDRDGSGDHELLELDIDLLEPNRYQPRQTFSEGKLEDLAQSIKAHGIVQPIVARRHGDRYQIVAGERRWRVASGLGLLKVPVLVKVIGDERLLEASLIENIQRENLNPIEEAKAYQRLAHEFNLTQEDLAERTGKDRSTVTNFMRILKLPEDIQDLVLQERLSMGHARALLALDDAADQRELAKKCLQHDWSVRELERTISQIKTGQIQQTPEPKRLDPNVKAAIEKLERALGTRVRIVERKNKGRIEIEYYSQEELNRLYEYLVREGHNKEEGVD